MNKIVVVGECMVELSLLKDNTYKQVFSGDSLNCCLNLKKILKEAEVEYLTVLGKDKLSKDMLEFFYKKDIKTTYINITENKNPIVYINNSDTNPTYLPSNSLKKDLSFTKFSSITNKLSEFDLLYFSSNSISMMNDEERISFFKMIKKLRMHGVKVVFEFNYISKMYKSRDEAIKIYETSIHYTDILLSSISDEKQLWGNIDTLNIANKARKAGCDEIIVKCGNEEIAYNAKKVVSKINTKDLNTKNIFNSMYLANRLKNNSIEESIINTKRFIS